MSTSIFGQSLPIYFERTCTLHNDQSEILANTFPLLAIAGVILAILFLGVKQKKFAIASAVYAVILGAVILLNPKSDCEHGGFSQANEINYGFWVISILALTGLVVTLAIKVVRKREKS